MVPQSGSRVWAGFLKTGPEMVKRDKKCQCQPSIDIIISTYFGPIFHAIINNDLTLSLTLICNEKHLINMQLISLQSRSMSGQSGSMLVHASQWNSISRPPARSGRNICGHHTHKRGSFFGKGTRHLTFPQISLFPFDFHCKLYAHRKGYIEVFCWWVPNSLYLIFISC